MNLDKINKDALELKNTLSNLHDYVSNVNDTMSEMSSTINSVLNQENISSYIEKIETACECTKNVNDILSEGREIYTENLSNMQQSISSLMDGKNDLDKLITHGYEFIKKVESINDIQNMIKNFDTLTEDLAKVDVIKDNLYNSRKEAEQLSEAARSLAGKAEEFKQVTDGVMGLKEDLLTYNEKVSEYNEEIGKYTAIIKDLDNKISQNAKYIELLNTDINRALELQEKSASFIIDLRNIHDDYVTKYKNVKLELNAFAAQICKVVEAGLQEISEKQKKHIDTQIEDMDKLFEKLEDIKKITENNKLHIEKLCADNQAETLKEFDFLDKKINGLNYKIEEERNNINLTIAENNNNNIELLKSLNQRMEKEFSDLKKSNAEIMDKLIEQEHKNKIFKIIIAIMLLLGAAVYGIMLYGNNENSELPVNDEESSQIDFNPWENHAYNAGIGTIGGITLRNTKINEVEEIYGSPTLKRKATEWSDCYVYGSKDEDAPLKVFYNRDTKTITGIVVSQGYHVKSNKGIGLGDDINLAASAYGEAAQIENSGSGKKYVYIKDGELIEFWTNSKGVIVAMHSQVI